MTQFLVWLLGSILIGAWSRSKGCGFASGFFWSLLLSPLIGALITGMRMPRKYAIYQPNGSRIVFPTPDGTGMPRPIFCAAMIVAITLLIAALAGCA